MIRSLLRMLKHITLAVLAIVCTVCIAEVGLRGYQLYRQCDAGGACELAPRPCAVAFHRLPPLQQTTRAGGQDGAEVAIRTNRLGLRGPIVAIPKTPEVIRIVCLGDDATFAADIPEEQTFAARLQQELSRQSGSPVEVVNAGIPGYCPLLALAWARQQLVALQPDLVVLCCDRTDVADDRRVRPLARYAADGSLEAICHPAAAQHSHNFVQAIEHEFQLATLLRRQLSASLGDDADSSDLTAAWDAADSSTGSDALQIRQTWEPIVPLRDLCDQISADFVVALVPSRPASGSANPAQDWTVQLLSETASQAGVPYLDVSADFAPVASVPNFCDQTGALSGDGHQLFAELLSWAILRRNGETANPVNSTPPTATPVIAPASATLPAEPLPFQSPPSSASATPQVSPTAVPPAGPSPLPTLRRPRIEDEEPDWAQ
jgi:hypothetical protein